MQSMYTTDTEQNSRYFLNPKTLTYLCNRYSANADQNQVVTCCNDNDNVQVLQASQVFINRSGFYQAYYSTYLPRNAEISEEPCDVEILFLRSKSD